MMIRPLLSRSLLASVPTVLAAAVVFSLLAGCDSGPPERVSETQFVLGTAVTITAQQHGVSRGTLVPAFERTTEIQNLMSINEADYETTEVLEINRAAGVGPIMVSPDTLLVIREGIRFGELTEGAFDITVAPLIRLWGFGTEEAAVPPAEEIGRVLEHIDYTVIEVGGKDGRDTAADAARVDETGDIAGSVYLPVPGMGIDVGGIAKGYAAEEAARVLREEGVENAILDFGGDIVTIGGRPDGTPWRIGIQHPSGQRGRFIGILESRDESVVSSGAYERYFTEDGVRYHHIFDPATGYPAETDLTSVTVVGVGAMQTDALSTAIFVMGLDAGLALLESLPEYDGILATEDMRVVVTSGIADRFEVPGDEYELIVR